MEQENEAEVDWAGPVFDWVDGLGFGPGGNRYLDVQDHMHI
jgi:hypothetical protein